MLRHVGAQRSDRIDLELGAILSTVAGALNAVGYQVAGVFSANMTGNVSALADHAAHGDWTGSIAFAGLVVTFVTGAFCAASLIHLGEAQHMRAVHAGVIILEAVLLIALWLWVRASGAPAGSAGLTTALSFLMGMQNATTTVISKARVRTTHVSGTATDFGIEAAALFAGSEARRLARPMLRLHGLTILCFALGGIGGALLYAGIGEWLFALAALALLTAAVPEAVRAMLAD
uniref:YoaK family protein n=1 Tax=Paenirhodobacter enshiensis TaxID=1105367 RepID=UPI0035AF9AC0